MMFSELANQFPELSSNSVNDFAISGITLNSKKVMANSIFVALDGKNFKAEAFVEEAVKKKAAAIFSERHVQSQVPNFILSDLRKKLGRLSHFIYDKPSLSLKTLGVTGTNGKTTTALLTQHVLNHCGMATGYLGTLGCFYADRRTEQDRTSPEASDLQELLADMKREGCVAVSLECSSHGIDLGRLNSLHLDVAIFTNLTQDHLDFHGTMASYADAKKALFTDILKQSAKTDKTAVFNLDDKTGMAWAESLDVNQKNYALQANEKAYIYVKKVESGVDGSQGVFSVAGEDHAFEIPLVGEFNLSNTMAAIAGANALGVSIEKILPALKVFPGVPGRLQRVPHASGPGVFVDYAHTPDALENVLKTLRPLSKGNLWAVFGCGGDRDKSKRPKMANIVSKLADISILTSDNPRTEEPMDIIADMKPGIPNDCRQIEISELPKATKKSFCIEADRRVAIEAALKAMSRDDVLLIAGKGHETYQEIKGVKYPFDDFAIAQQNLERVL